MPAFQKHQMKSISYIGGLSAGGVVVKTYLTGTPEELAPLIITLYI